MAKKEDLFGKLNMKDYNNRLEEILEKKDFSSDTKNFLLSMLYKVENSYNDYATVKNISKTKGEFITEIIDIIDKECETIELIKPLDKEYKDILKIKEKCIVNKNEKKIIALYNEQVMLYAIFKLKNNNYKFKNDILKEPLTSIFSTGEAISAKEIIRDFDGWAWNIERNLIEDIECNLIFQTINLLIGSNSKTELEIKQKLLGIFKKEDAKKAYITICKVALAKYLKDNSDKINIYKEYKEKTKTELTKMENKAEYLKEITTKRKKAEKRLKDIDKFLLDVNLLKQEYIKTNKKLKADEKIFSISDFVEKLQEEKNIKMCELQKYNKKMLPKNYISEKEKLIEDEQVLDILDSKKNIYYYILELQEMFIQGIKNKIKQTQTRKDVMDIIYRLRYYKNIPYADKQIYAVDKLKESICKTEEMVYNIANKMKVLNTISVNSEINNQVIQEILNTKVVELENIELLFRAENYQIVLRIFDEDNIEKTLEYDTIEGLIVRMNRKFRMFIK